MKKVDIVFVILNFNSLRELNNCINSIKTYCCNCEWKVVVVDNGSSDTEKSELLGLYRDDDKVKILINNENLGFAKGNNVGLRYVKNNYKCSFVAMINSDTLLTSDKFYDLLQKAYDEYQFAVLGPDIIGSHDNPMKNPLDTKQRVLSEINQMKKERNIMQIPVMNYIFLFFKRLKRNTAIWEKDENVEGCQLHGCFLVFSNLYSLDGLCEETFLYGEEAILAKDCYDSGLKLLYYPDIKIIHKESLATKSFLPQRIRRKKFYYDNYIESLKILLRKFD